MIPGTLPIAGILLRSVTSMLQAPQAFARAALPACAIMLVAELGRQAAPDSLWLDGLEHLGELVFWTMLATHWHRSLILGMPPRWQWRRAEGRYLVFSIMLVALIILPPLMLTLTLQAVFEPLMNAMAGWGAIAVLIGTFSMMAAPVLTFVLMVALSVPMWLWLPSEAIGRDQSWDDISAMVKGERLRLFLVNGAALAIGVLPAYVLDWAGLSIPALMDNLASLIFMGMEVGVLSLCYVHLSAMKTEQPL